MAYEPDKHLVKVKGGQMYLPVKDRLVWFREEHPDGTIDTTVIFADYDAGLYVVRAQICIPGGGSATGHKTETHKDFPAGAMEKAETGAIGRALAALGYGTQFATDFDEGERVVDATVETRRSTPREQATTTQATTQQATERPMHVVRTAETETPAKTTAVKKGGGVSEEEAKNKGLLIQKLAAEGHRHPQSWREIVSLAVEHYGMEELSDEQLKDDDLRAQWLAVLVDKLGAGEEDADAGQVVAQYRERITAASSMSAVNAIMQEAKKGAGLDKDNLAVLVEASNTRLAALRPSP